MPGRIRYHLDEHVDPRVADGLRRRGIDVTTTVEAELRTRGDDRQFEYMMTTGRVIVTRDKDFIEIARIRLDHPGIAFYARQRTIGYLVQKLTRLYQTTAAEEMVGRIEYI